jgi:hypothetical protein
MHWRILFFLVPMLILGCGQLPPKPTSDHPGPGVPVAEPKDKLPPPPLPDPN